MGRGLSSWWLICIRHCFPSEHEPRSGRRCLEAIHGAVRGQGNFGQLIALGLEKLGTNMIQVAPAVSNSQNPGEGLEWLKSFMDLCTGCNIGAVNQHWYDTTSNDVSLFQQQISSAHEQSGLPVFVGEFGFIGSDSDISEALNQVLGWLDANDSVVGYAYFMVGDGYLNDGCRCPSCRNVP